MSKREEWIGNKKRNYESSLSDIIYATVKPTLKKYSKLEADIILNWGKIFDGQLARKISFKKIVFTNKKANKFVLHVSVANKDMLEITHATEIIKEQLSIFLGFNGCEKVMVSKV